MPLSPGTRMIHTWLLLEAAWDGGSIYVAGSTDLPPVLTSLYPALKVFFGTTHSLPVLIY